MKPGDMDIIREATQKHGDGFWNDDDGANIALVGEVAELLLMHGYSMEIVKIELHD